MLERVVRESSLYLCSPNSPRGGIGQRQINTLLPLADILDLN